jgi:tetratricopeptide (TPR) repeat protein
MLIARRKPSHSQQTLRRRYDFHIGEAARASVAGSFDKAAAHSQTALSIGRELFRSGSDYRPELAAALACHAASSAAYGRIGDALSLLTESAGHYAILAAADPEAHEVRRLDVLTRVALASDVAGHTEGAITLLREVIAMYGSAPATIEAERYFGRARARFHLGRCLLKSGERDTALAALDAGLADAERAWARLPVSCISDAAPGFPQAGEAESTAASWLAAAPRFVQLAAPDWAAAAVRAMGLHAAARHWASAARAARIAVRLSAGLAAVGGDGQQERYAAMRARADDIWARARQEQFQRAPACTPEGVLKSQTCSTSTNRLREASTSASAAVRSTHLMPSTALPGSRSL